MTETLIFLGMIVVLLVGTIWLGVRVGKSSGTAQVSSTETAQAKADATLAEQYQAPLTHTDEQEVSKLNDGTF